MPSSRFPLHLANFPLGGLTLLALEVRVDGAPLPQFAGSAGPWEGGAGDFGAPLELHGEVEEIAAFVGEDQPGSGFYQSAARFYEAIAADFEGPRAETSALDAFCEKATKG